MSGKMDDATSLLLFTEKAVVASSAPEETYVFTESISPGVTPASDGRASPSFSRPESEPPTLQRSDHSLQLALGGLLGIAETPHASQAASDTASQPPTLSRTASELAGIHSLMGLAATPSSAKRSLVGATASLPPSKKRLCSSGVTVQQMKLAAAAFHLCPEPTDVQMQAIAARVGLPLQRVVEWFQARQALQGWVVDQKRQFPSVKASDLVSALWERCATAR